MPTQCVFCGGGTAFPNEHVLPAWAAQFVGIGRVDVTGRRLDDSPRTWEQVGSFGQTINSVCQRCNDGWMGDLEQLARPVLERLIKPRGDVRLSSDEQTVVAAWLWKLAIMHEHASRDRYFNRRERECLIDLNDPPENGVRAWVGAYVGDLAANLRGGPGIFSAPRGRVLKGFLMSMSLGQFAAQLLCVRMPSDLPVKAPGGYDLGSAEVQIWPAADVSASWPPAMRLTTSRFDQWHSRWKTEDEIDRGENRT